MTARSNGLRASAYAVLIEIEESLGDPMLAALAAREIAAYVEPTRGPGATTRLMLYVDVLQRASAAVALAGLTPAIAGDSAADAEPARDPGTAGDPAGETGSAGASTDDAAFAAIVEGFHLTPATPTWPEAEDLPNDPPGPLGAAAPGTSVLPGLPPRHAPKKWDPKTDVDRRRPSPPAPAPPPPDPAEEFDASDDEEHYTPPPLPRLDPPPFATRWALFGLLFGLALLLVPTFFDFGHRTSLDIAGVLCVVGSGAILVARLRDRSPDDPDDGAVV